MSVAIGSAQADDQIVLLGSSPFHLNGGNTALLDAGNNTIATVSSANSASWTITLTNLATATVVNQLVEAFGFETTSTNTADRSVTFTFSDGGNTGTGGALSDPVTQTVHVATPASEQIYFRINQGQFGEIQLGDINNNGTARHTIYFGGGNTSSTATTGAGNESPSPSIRPPGSSSASESAGV